DVDGRIVPIVDHLGYDAATGPTSPAIFVTILTGLTQRLHDLFDHLLGVGEQHHRIVAVEKLVVDAGIADAAHRALHAQNRLRLLHVEHRHAIDGRAFVGLRG